MALLGIGIIALILGLFLSDVIVKFLESIPFYRKRLSVFNIVVYIIFVWCLPIKVFSTVGLLLI